MKAFVKALPVAIAVVALAAPAGHAATIIDFGTGTAGAGGTISIGANVTGSGILIDTVTIAGAPANNGVYDVNGTAACLTGLSGVCGILSFDRNLNTISLVGSIPGLGILTPVTLLSGDLSGGLNIFLDNGLTGSLTASGHDTKGRELLVALGLDPATPWTYFAFTTGVNGAGQGSPYTAISTDITNTSVPEPTSIALVGAGLLASIRAIRRRVAKAS